MSTARLANIREQILPIAYRPGVHTSTYLRSAGFRYTGIGDTACCDECKLSISNWTKDMNPFKVHAQDAPTCPVVLSFESPLPLSPMIFRDQLLSTVQNNSTPERQAVEANDFPPLTVELVENRLLQKVRDRTFSHWPHNERLSRGDMIEAGYFCCNVGDRVICLYCNMICQHWTPNVDNPKDVHKTLSPRCPYVQSKLTNREPIQTINNRMNFSINNTRPIDMSENVQPIPQLQNHNRSDIEDSIQADYFNINKKNNTNCPGCGDLLSYTGFDDTPLVEHARRNPHCPYILQCSNVESIRTSLLLVNTHRTPMTRQETISKRIQAGMTLPMSEQLLRKFPAHIVRQCWEDQIKFKNEQFQSIHNLFIACLIRQKQDRHIGDKENNIIIPSVRMREHEQNAINAYRQQHATVAIEPCVICYELQRCLACLPCGHLAMCVPCGHSVRLCPMCRDNISALIRIKIL